MTTLPRRVGAFVAGLLLSALLVLSAAAQAPAHDAVGASGPAPAPAEGVPAPAAQPAAADQPTAAPAEIKKSEEKTPAEKLQIFNNILEQGRDYLLTVAIRWQKDQGESPGVEYRYYGGYSRTSSYGEVGGLVDQKTSSEALGVMLDPAQGLIVASDYDLEPRFIESTKGITPEGKEFSLKLNGFYRDVGLAVYKTEAWPGKKEPLQWFTGELNLFGDSGCAVGLSRNRLGWEISVSSGGGDHVSRPVGSSALETSGGGQAGLVFDDEGRPLGVASNALSLVGDRFPWRGPDLLKQKVVTLEEFEKLKAATLQRCDKFAHEVRIVYRQPEEHEENLRFESEDPTGLTQYYYGYAISPRRILVPVKMEKIYIQRLKTITVDLDGKVAEAKFLGAYLNFGGFVVELQEATSPAQLPAEFAPLPEFNRAVLTYLHERKFGKRRNVVWYNRVGEYQRGYNDRLWPSTQGPLSRGTLAMDFDGRPIGLCLIERRPEEEKKGEQERYRYGGSDGNLLLYTMQDLAEAFGNPEQHFDPNLKPASEQEEKRLVWLGVAFQPVGPALAEILDDTLGGDQTRKLTRGGEVGLRVTYVYSNSPAAKAGLAVGDILLEIQEPGKDKPIELKPLSGYDDYGTHYSFGSRSRYFRRASSPSFGTRDYLTQLLTRLGPGARISLAYLHGKEKLTHDFALEWAPYDFDSARKFKDEKAGLTVKDLTYDVRALLRLADDQPGVIVAKVEDGQKADIAQIMPQHIITHINGQPVKDVKDFEDKMAPIEKGEGPGTAELTLLWLGKSNIVRIQFP